MLFNSLDFAIFLPIVFLLYWFVTQKNLKLQNALIVVASYVFYGWWDWRCLSLIIFSTVVDYLIGQRLRTEDKQSKRKVLLWTSIVVNLGFLGFFKYYNFTLLKSSFIKSYICDLSICQNFSYDCYSTAQVQAACQGQTPTCRTCHVVVHSQ